MPVQPKTLLDYYNVPAAFEQQRQAMTEQANLAKMIEQKQGVKQFQQMLTPQPGKPSYIDQFGTINMAAVTQSPEWATFSQKHPELAQGIMSGAGMFGTAKAPSLTTEGVMTKESADALKVKFPEQAAQIEASVGKNVLMEVDPRGRLMKYEVKKAVDVPTTPLDRRWVELDTKSKTGKLTPSEQSEKKSIEAFQAKIKPSGALTLREDKERRELDQAQPIAEAIMRGDQPPTTAGRGVSTAVMTKVKKILADEGFKLRDVELDYLSTRKHLMSLNSPAQLRLRQATEFTKESLSLVRDLGEQWKGGNFPKLNKANLKLAMEGAYGQDAQSLATRLNAQITDLQAELSVVYKGGGTPTDMGMKQAEEMLKAEWSEKTLMDVLDLLDKNLNIRLTSMNATKAVTTAGVPGVEDVTAPKPTPAPAPKPAPATPADIQRAIDKY